jgi:hypothetical protein
MGLLAGDTPSVTNFDMWFIGHVEHGWLAKLEDKYIKEHGSAPKGDDAAAIRAAYCKDYAETRLDSQEMSTLSTSSTLPASTLR